MRAPLQRDDVISVVKRQSCNHVPVLFHKWWGQGLAEKYGSELTRLDKIYPDDFLITFHLAPGEDTSSNKNPEYRWGFKQDYSQAERHSIAEQKILLDDWADLDSFINHMPDPYEKGIFDDVKIMVEQNPDRYRLGCWWRFLHERFWSIRGMENLMLDYYDNLDGLYRIGKKLIGYYKALADRYAELGFDAVMISDDLGHQTGPMMSPDIFAELYYPLYKEFNDYVHQKNMSVFLHTCGDNTKLMPYLIDSGIDVIHPIQKGCMDYESASDKYGKDITFMVGVDVQDLLPNGTAAEIEKEIDMIKSIFCRPGQGLLLSAGNGILSDTPIINIETMLQKMVES